MFLMTLKQIWSIKGSVATFEGAYELLDGFNFDRHSDSPIGWFRLLADNEAECSIWIGD